MHQSGLFNRIEVVAALSGLLLAAGSLSAAAGGECAQSKAAAYPTTAIADYVVGCMLANGASATTLEKCSCSFDIIAAAVPYAEYEKVETLMRLQQIQGGGRTGAYKGSSWAKGEMEHFKEVQAESTLRCF
ncbi:hypothetical protein [Thiorhodococcus minor]|uniref:Uncharacterized protein n=1 Tax=Thiorhodococcus minor TaxID=57489 RepID=A0A6M0K378_9GAMM|nr:hypothetical protein [Thiorhodococcus minor]NEV63721.1 hypothetical protein [Thiorhodococcus minor]